MIAGLTGSLLSHDALIDWLRSREGRGAKQEPGGYRRLSTALGPALAELGPAYGPRAVFDRLAVPLARALDLQLTLRAAGHDDALVATLESSGKPQAVMLVIGWGREPAEGWRTAVRHGIGAGVRWCLCLNGPSLRIVDARRTYTRRFTEIALQTAATEPATADLLLALLHARSFAAPTGCVLDDAVRASEQHRASVRASLQEGVHAALAHLMDAFTRSTRRHPHRRLQPAAADQVFDESLTVVYRILFLLFSEARGLVPTWHPLYRESYTIESLRGPVEVNRRPPGVWETLQAIARLVHEGCRAGTLRVPPFNGRLFSPARAPLAARARLDDGAVREALLALTTRPGRHARERISYGDLGVEQLGGVYERLLDYSPVAAAGAPVLVRAGGRKASGSFYTPRSLTEYVVRRTLAPLVQDARPGQILSLRVLDPAMGSGAFLVAACRYLGTSYETALQRESGVTAADLSDQDRAGFRRLVAQHCLFGVDINPMAVQLGRLSLWLATLASDRPLTFLDHHMRAGNSLVGATLLDIARRPAATGRRKDGPLPLFDMDEPGPALALAIGPRLAITTEPADTLEQVRRKESLLASVRDGRAPLTRWKDVADLWCAAWFQDGRAAQYATVFNSLADELLGRHGALPSRVSAPLLDAARTAAEAVRFFHWPLEFPEVFYDADGHPLAHGGFDAILGNPPWEMLRGDSGESDDRRAAADASARLTAFARRSGVYKLQGNGHANLFQLFVERSLQLVRPGGRLGLVLPGSFATDHGSAALRREVLDRTSVDACVSVENRDALFPIHRSFRFLLLCSTAGGSTPAFPYRSGVRSPETLDQLPELGADPSSIALARSLLEQLSGPLLAIPEIRGAADLDIVSRLAFSYPPLGDPDGWNVHFGRELNATDDRKHFMPLDRPRRGVRLMPIIEGKQVHPFSVDVRSAVVGIPAVDAAKLLASRQTFGHRRLAYRDVSGATNRMTLIAALLPPEVVTTHTVFCQKEPLDDGAQLFLCGIFNSFVANFLVRLRVGTHVGAAIIERLPVPRPERDDALFVAIGALAARLTAWPGDESAAAMLQASVARLYGLSRSEFRHVLGTFPLVDAAFRERCREVFDP